MFKPQRPNKIKTIPNDYENRCFQEKIDGGNVVISVELPAVKIFHAREKIWNERGYRYPELIKEIRQGKVLQDKAVYIGELTVLDQQGTGKAWLFLKRQMENNFQIKRMSKLSPVVFFPHHIIIDKGIMQDDLIYAEQLQLLGNYVKEGNCVKTIPTFNTPQPLLEKKGTIEGIIIKDLNGTYHKGKRGMGWEKLKFLKEKTVKFISYERQTVGIKLYTDDNKPVHLSGSRVETAVENIETNGYCMAELEFFMETNKGFRDCSIKRIGNLKEIEV